MMVSESIYSAKMGRGERNGPFAKGCGDERKRGMR